MVEGAEPRAASWWWRGRAPCNNVGNEFKLVVEGAEPRAAKLVAEGAEIRAGAAELVEGAEPRAKRLVEERASKIQSRWDQILRGMAMAKVKGAGRIDELVG